MTVDKSKHKYAYISTEDIDLMCMCGDNINVNAYWDDETECYQAKCSNCNQRWIVVVNFYPVKHDD